MGVVLSWSKTASRCPPRTPTAPTVSESVHGPGPLDPALFVGSRQHPRGPSEETVGHLHLALPPRGSAALERPRGSLRNPAGQPRIGKGQQYRQAPASDLQGELGLPASAGLPQRMCKSFVDLTSERTARSHSGTGPFSSGPHPQPPPNFGRGEIGSVPVSAPPRPAFGRAGYPRSGWRG